MKYLLLLAFAVYIAIGLSARVASDDYCAKADVQTYGIIGAASHTYQTWSGRFSHLLASNVLYAVFHEAAPAVAAIGLIAALALASWRLNGVAGLLGALALILALRANVWQGVYWLPGGITYLAPIIAGLFLYRLSHRWLQ